MYIKTIEDMIADTREKTIIDMRPAEDYARETYPGAINVFWEDFDAFMENGDGTKLSKDIPIYLICLTGKNSDLAAERYEGLGYEIYSIEAGWHSYLRYNLRRMMEEEDALAQRTRDIERSIMKTFHKELWSRFIKGIKEFDMIQDGDRIAVCISGGKDSMVMAKLFQELYRHGKRNFELVFLVMDPGYNEINRARIMDNARLLDIPVTVFESDIFDSVESVGNSPCYLCARMRRGHLYAKAKELGCNKIALGHHYDDVIETVLMGMLYGGQMQGMMPKLHSTNFEGMELIRPMYYIRERDICRWRDYNKLFFINCACRFTESCASCGGTDKGSKRAEIKTLIKTLEQDNPFVASNIFKSVENVSLDTLICYKQNGERHHFLDTY